MLFLLHILIFAFFMDTSTEGRSMYLVNMQRQNMQKSESFFFFDTEYKHITREPLTCKRQLCPYWATTTAMPLTDKLNNNLLNNIKKCFI